MSLRRVVRPMSFVLLFCLLAWYSQHFFGEVREDILVCTWNLTFHSMDASCIYWITLRLTAWIFIYLRLLRLESGFSIYLFLRQRSYFRVFARTYAECVGAAICYYGIGTLIMAVYHSVTRSEIDMGSVLRQSCLVRIVAEECLECLGFCLTAYMVYCVFKKAETAFLAVLAGRLLLNFMTGRMRPTLPVQTMVNLAITGLGFYMGFHGFVEKIGDKDLL